MIIASRVLTLRNEDATETDIPVRIFAPEKDDIDWSCRYEIDWPDGCLSHAAIGVDAIQALDIALRLIGAVLYASDYHETGKLSWLERGQGYGFPVPSNLRDMLVGYDAKYF